MPLPKIKHPVFNVTIPSTKQKIKMRPFLVKEEKLILMAQSSKEFKDIIDAIKQLLNNTIITEDIDVEKLTTFDVEYMFIKLRSKSVGEVIDISITKDEVEYKGQINLDQVEIYTDPDHSSNIKLDNGLGLVMKYPTFDQLAEMPQEEQKEPEIDTMFNLFLSCVDHVYDQDQVYDEFSKEELNEFIESLDSSSLEKITKFFETIPSIKHKVIVTSEDGKTEEVDLEGLSDFFMY